MGNVGGRERELLGLAVLSYLSLIFVAGPVAQINSRENLETHKTAPANKKTSPRASSTRTTS